MSMDQSAAKCYDAAAHCTNIMLTLLLRIVLGRVRLLVPDRTIHCPRPIVSRFCVQHATCCGVGSPSICWGGQCC